MHSEHLCTPRYYYIGTVVTATSICSSGMVRSRSTQYVYMRIKVSEIFTIPVFVNLFCEGSQKVSFPILLPPNNFTQWDASLFTYYTPLHLYFHSYLLCWSSCLGGKSISQNPVDRRWNPDHAAMFAPHAFHHHMIWISWHEDVFHVREEMKPRRWQIQAVGRVLKDFPGSSFQKIHW